MKTSTASVLLACSPDVFWRVYLDTEYLRALYLGALGHKGFDVLEVTETSRKLRVVPKMKLPGPVDALIGNSFAYEDHGTLDRAKNEWTWRMVQPKDLDPRAKPRKDVLTARGTVRVEPVGDGQCRRTDEVVIEAKIFGLGGVIESSAEKELSGAWAKEFAFLTKWLDEGFFRSVAPGQGGAPLRPLPFERSPRRNPWKDSGKYGSSRILSGRAQFL